MAEVDVEKAQAWSLLDQLREPEGAAVLIYAPNYDIEGASQKIAVVDDWTDWEPAEFEGDTVAECLREALRARVEKDREDRDGD